MSSIDLLRIVFHFKPETICAMLGFKFRFYERPGVSEPTPSSLYTLTARLLEKNVFDINLMYSYVSEAQIQLPSFTPDPYRCSLRQTTSLSYAYTRTFRRNIWSWREVSKPSTSTCAYFHAFDLDCSN
jgi:hypothetical protein